MSCLVIVSSRDMSISGEYHFEFRGVGTEGLGVNVSCRFQSVGGCLHRESQHIGNKTLPKRLTLIESYVFR